MFIIGKVTLCGPGPTLNFKFRNEYREHTVCFPSLSQITLHASERVIVGAAHVPEDKWEQNALRAKQLTPEPVSNFSVHF